MLKNIKNKMKGLFEMKKKTRKEHENIEEEK